jgi:hypothetical protein
VLPIGTVKLTVLAPVDSVQDPEFLVTTSPVMLPVTRSNAVVLVENEPLSIFKLDTLVENEPDAVSNPDILEENELDDVSIE